MKVGEGSKRSITIAVDAMGADLGPAEVIAGARLALADREDIARIDLVGTPSVLDTELAGDLADGRLAVVESTSVISMDDKPIQALKRKKDSSMVIALDLVREGKVSAMVSCGNTGALMAGGTIKLRPIAGMERPALASVWPRNNQHFLVLDVGANPDPKPDHLVHYALLGSLYYSAIFGVERPRVGLLTIGTEEGKGTELIQQTHDQLKLIGDRVNYLGPIEGYDVFRDSVDVVLCDGFSGNLILKTCQSLAGMFKQLLREEFTRTPVRKLGAVLASGAFKDIRSKTSRERYGGAPLLGLRGNVIKAHGSSNRDAIRYAIGIAAGVSAFDLNERAIPQIAEINACLKAPVEATEAALA